MNAILSISKIVVWHSSNLITVHIKPATALIVDRKAKVSYPDSVSFCYISLKFWYNLAYISNMDNLTYAYFAQFLHGS